MVGTKVKTVKVLYGLLFAAVITIILILWANYTKNIVMLPLPNNLLLGYILLITGSIFVCSGTWTLWRSDNGSPLKAFPPRILVKNGIYAFIRHPIYTGAAMISFGLSAVARSSSGFWLVSPVFILLMVTYIAGFENEKTQSVFGARDYKPFLSLPSASDILSSFNDRISSYFLVFVPWLIIYEAFIFIGAPRDAIVTNLPFEEHLPIWEFSVVFYSFYFLFILSVPLVIRTRKQLRRYITDMWFALIIVGIIYLVFPMMVKQKNFIPHSFLGSLILFERSHDGESGALPSCHVILAFLAARYFSKSTVRPKWIWYALAAVISASCITTGAHSLLDVIAGFCTFMLIIYRQQVWNYIRLQAEHLSNSWREWKIGPIRMMNHGFYGGAAGFAGVLLAGFFLGRQYALVGFLIMILIIIGAGLWARIIEGSLKSLRPYTYYGVLTGGIIACLLAHFIFSIDFFILLASFAIAAPWIQAIGRLQCLVRGCCYEKPSSEDIDIRFIHPNSRVNKISDPAGVPLHPTQLYSIGTNIVTGLILIRLFNISISSSFIVGMYLILNGAGRFMEESFRGEAQTQYWAGMKIYQWIAIPNILLGIIFTAIPNRSLLGFQPNLLSLILAFGAGILVTLVSGVNFPESN
ncbi:MAG: prolipoprotein diacylglyceryl transferase family protein [Bacteroidales bacterium]|jgi:protein-S-isoprenylcysteine O-methyltransferase Ste14/membrane-associated phospholipid phosphatase